MRVLLDTHAIYWFATNDIQLSSTAMDVISDGSNDILVSPASYWEMAIKIALGKWEITKPYDELIESLWTVYGFQILPILPSHTSEIIQLPFHHRDPFDRMLIAQAKVEAVPIVTADDVFELYGIPRIWK